MRERNLRKYIAAGLKRLEKHPQYGLGAGEAYYLAHNKDTPIQNVTDAFYAGVEAGVRMTKKYS